MLYRVDNKRLLFNNHIMCQTACDKVKCCFEAKSDLSACHNLALHYSCILPFYRLTEERCITLAVGGKLLIDCVIVIFIALQTHHFVHFLTPTVAGPKLMSVTPSFWNSRYSLSLEYDQMVCRSTISLGYLQVINISIRRCQSTFSR